MGIVSASVTGQLTVESHLSPVRRFDAQSAAFAVCCAYVLSQVYLVPLWPIGPSWSVWPSLTDLTIFLMLPLQLFIRLAPQQNRHVVVGKRYLLLLTGGALASYLLLTLDPLDLKAIDVLNDKGQNSGLYQLYRLSQALIVFWFVTSIRFTPARKEWLCRVTGIAFWVSSALVVLNYFDVVDTPSLSPQIPKILSVAGPWAFYSMGVVRNPVGAISYHHAYPTIQLLVLAATYISLLPRRRLWTIGLVLGALWATSFISGSRAGFAAVTVFVLLLFISTTRVFISVSIISLLVLLLSIFYTAELADPLSMAATRQASITSSYEEDGLAGRVDIWKDRMALLNQFPAFWLTGTGFGSAAETGSNGHMLFLHITLECGLGALLVFLIASYKLLRAMWRDVAEGRILCYATVALLASSLTQETFYPVPAFGQFCGMYLFCLGIAFSWLSRSPSQERRIPV